MDHYIQPLTSAKLPSSRSKVISQGRHFDNRRSRYLQRHVDDLFSSPQMKAALAYHRAHICSRTKSRVPEVAAVTSIVYPKCASCHRKDCLLFYCPLCGVVNACSDQCWRAIRSDQQVHRPQCSHNVCKGFIFI